MEIAFEHFIGRPGPSFLDNRRRWDVPPSETADLFKRNVISAPCLGAHGRWGNAVLQYMFLRAFASHYGVGLETPPWLGKFLFGLTEPAVSQRPKTVILDGLSRITNLGVNRMQPHDINAERAQHLLGSDRTLLLLRGALPELDPRGLPFSEAEMEGLFLVHSRHIAAHKDLLQEILQPVPGICEGLREGLARLRSLGKTIVGLHIRRGDFVGGLMAQNFELVMPLDRYREWLRTIWPTLDAPVLFLSSDDEDLVEEFAEFSPMTARSLGAEIPAEFNRLPLPEAQLQRDATFFADWHLLAQCDVLAVSNSTFSFSAALLNRRARLFFRPTFECEIVAFDPWNSEPLLFVEPHRCLAWELFRRVALNVRISGWRDFPAASLKAILGFNIMVSLRVWYALHLRGLAGLRVLFDPRLYLASQYHVG